MAVSIFALISDMPGRQFLVVYGIFSAIVLVGVWLLLRSSDKTHLLPPLFLPKHPDPYEIAYLRGGANAVTRLGIVDLVQRRYLETTEESTGRSGSTEKRIRQSVSRAEVEHLSSLQQTVFNGFRDPQRPGDLFRSRGLASSVELFCQSYKQRLELESLLLPRGARMLRTVVRLGAIAALLGLGGYKLTAALTTGHYNVFFLILLTGLASIIAAIMYYPTRLSRRGRDYLKRLQETFSEHDMEPATDNAIAAPDGLLLLGVGLMGMGHLADTDYASLQEVFRASGQGGAGGCGDGCGGGCGDGCGGGCGDGCGGCGD